ncbi:MAG: response regulator [Bacteroidota bacterium]|nr:response regulator [Bacteroidota bacterium]
MTYSKSILLVDDDNISNFLVSLQLSTLENPLPFHIAINAEAAIKYLKSLDKASKVLILLDIHMPVLDGFEFLEHLENVLDIEKSLLDIVIISSSIVQKDFDKANEIGIHKFLLKPIKKENLQLIINEFELV